MQVKQYSVYAACNPGSCSVEDLLKAVIGDGVIVAQRGF